MAENSLSWRRLNTVTYIFAFIDITNINVDRYYHMIIHATHSKLIDYEYNPFSSGKDEEDIQSKTQSTKYGYHLL